MEWTFLMVRSGYLGVYSWHWNKWRFSISNCVNQRLSFIMELWIAWSLISSGLSKLCVKKRYHHCSRFQKEWFTCTQVVKIPLLINVPWIQEIFHARFPVTIKSHTASLFAWLWPSASLRPTPKHPAARYKKLLALVVETLNSVIHQINQYPEDKY